jgi:hypothetical protein
MTFMDYERFRVSRRDREPLLNFILAALQACGCRILHHSDASEAPFRVTFEAPDGERMGIIAYAFFANSRATRNRPTDEHRFQVKYGTKTDTLHELWQDPYALYTTLFFGINLEQWFFAAADPALHSPTRFFISVEFKEQHAAEILRRGWHAWEREKRTRGFDEPLEIMVGGVPEHFLSYVRFERAARGLDSGHRALLADKFADLERIKAATAQAAMIDGAVRDQDLHRLAAEFQLSQTEILDLIQSAPRLKMAVRGWVAETHLVTHLAALPGISTCRRLEGEGKPDVEVYLGRGRPIFIECKNVLRKPYADGVCRIDFQRTRASIGDPCSRFYAPEDFDVVAACLHPRTENWEFSFALSRDLDPHDRCSGKLSNRARVDDRWDRDAVAVLSRAST